MASKVRAVGDGWVMNKSKIMKISKIQILLSLCSIVLLAASCNPLSNEKSGAGVAKTTNSGVDWVFSNKAVVDTTKKNSKKLDSVLATSSVTSMKFAPSDNNTIFVSTQRNGLFVSRDGAGSWSQMLSNFGAYDVAIDSSNKDHILVVGQSGEQARVVQTRDGGKSWLPVYSDASGGQVARSIALAPGNSDTIVVGFASGNFIRSQDGGVTWALIKNFQDAISQIFWQGNSLYILTRTKGLFISTNGGDTVTNISKQLLNIASWRQKIADIVDTDSTNTGRVNVPSAETTAFYKVAVTEGLFKQIFIGATNGLFKSTDGGNSWQYLQLPLKSAQATEVRGVGLQNNGDVIFASVGNVIYKTSNAGNSWQVSAIATSAVINYILVDPKFDQVVYVGFIPGQ